MNTSKQQTTLWIYLYRTSKLGPRSIWQKQENCLLEEQTRTVCNKAIRHRLERVSIDHSPIKCPTVLAKPLDSTITCIYNMMDVMVASNPKLYTDVAYKLNIATQDERAVCKAYSDFAECLFQKTITWPLITSLFAFSGSLAAECTKNGRSILVRSICDWATVFTVMRLKDWILENGGWDAIMDYFGDFTLTATRRASLMFQCGRDKIRRASSVIKEELKNEIMSKYFNVDVELFRKLFSFEKNGYKLLLIVLFITLCVACLNLVKYFFFEPVDFLLNDGMYKKQISLSNGT